MEFPPSIPNNSKNAKAIEALLDRVRRLDKDAKSRLLSMLDDEVDLPYLDVMEREYAKAFRRISPKHANALRGRFNRALAEQREYLVGLVRKVLQGCEDIDLQMAKQDTVKD